MKKNKKIVLLFVLFFCFLSAFSYNTDPLYQYQWGLKNRGNGHLDKSVIRENYEIMYFNYDNALSAFPVFNYDNFADDLMYIQAIQNSDIGFEEAYSLYENIKNKKEIIVAVIDSGIDITHPELSESIWTNPYEIPGNGIDDDNNGYIDDICGYNFCDNNNSIYSNPVDDIHGTHAAGIIISSHNNIGVKGIAYSKEHSVKIMPLKVLGSTEYGSTRALCEAIEYAYKNGASICNISLGLLTNEERLNRLIKNYSNMLFVAAAGNGYNFQGYNIDGLPLYPASYNYDNVIAVSNLSIDGSRYESGNFGNSVDIYAPGTFILSTIPNNSYGFLSGTSMSAPFVSGVAAMLMSAYPKYDAYAIKKIITSSATIDGKLLGECASNGRLNAFNAMLLASQY